MKSAVGFSVRNLFINLFVYVVTIKYLGSLLILTGQIVYSFSLVVRGEVLGLTFQQIGSIIMAIGILVILFRVLLKKDMNKKNKIVLVAICLIGFIGNLLYGFHS